MVPVTHAWFVVATVVLALAGCKGDDKKDAAPAAKPATPSAEKTAQPATQPAAQPAAQPAQAPAAQPAATPTPPTGGTLVTTPSGLKYEELKVGDGATPQQGQTVVVHYTGWLTNGTKFDSSVDRGQPFKFVLGRGMVIKGWDEGLSTMKIGGKRKLTIPPELGYGARGAGGVIPPNATLVFDVELLGVQ